MTNLFNVWQEPKAPAILTEEQFDMLTTKYSLPIAVYAARTQSVALNVVKEWARKHLKK